MDVASRPTKMPGETAWVVTGPAGETLRQFVDSNADNKVDQWRYFRGGIEVYRDVDKDFDGKADQYRWLGTAGTRWGLDIDEDGEIDRWKSISPEEATRRSDRSDQSTGCQTIRHHSAQQGRARFSWAWQDD